MASIGNVGACNESLKLDVDRMQEQCDDLIVSGLPDLDRLDDLTEAQSYLGSATDFLKALGTDATEVTAELAKQSDDKTIASLGEIWTDLCDAIESRNEIGALESHVIGTESGSGHWDEGGAALCMRLTLRAAGNYGIDADLEKCLREQ
jgi:hypothetical protein